MSIDQADVVDLIGVDTTSGHVVLTISDHLDWTDEEAHLVALQEKINTYLRFIESGEILESYPKAKGRAAMISVALRVPPSAAGKEFFDKVRPVLAAAGVGFRTELYDQDDQVVS